MDLRTPLKKQKKHIPCEFPSGIYWISQLDNNNINLKNSSSDPGVSAASQYLSQDAVEVSLVLVPSTHSTRSYDHICLGTSNITPVTASRAVILQVDCFSMPWEDSLLFHGKNTRSTTTRCWEYKICFFNLLPRIYSHLKSY